MNVIHHFKLLFSQDMDLIHYDLDFPSQVWIGPFFSALKFGLESYKVLIFLVPFLCTFFEDKKKINVIHLLKFNLSIKI